MMPVVVMAPPAVVTPVPVGAMVAPAAVMVMMVSPAVVAPVMVMMAASAVVVAPAVVMAVLDLDRPALGHAGGPRREGSRLSGTAREEAACHHGRRRQHPPAGPHRVAHRQHRRLRFVSPHRGAAVEGHNGAAGLNAD